MNDVATSGAAPSAGTTQETPRTSLPPVVYVPSAGPSPDGTLRLELRRVDDGRVALLAYTALDRLLTGCGAQQPWALVPVHALDEINTRQPYDLVLLDVPLPSELRRTAAA